MVLKIQPLSTHNSFLMPQNTCKEKTKPLIDFQVLEYGSSGYLRRNNVFFIVLFA